MKSIYTIIALGVLVVFMTVTARPASATKWKGSWYLRGAKECREIVLNRKGRSDAATYPKAIVEKKGEDYFLTVESMGEKYSYHMAPREDSPNYDLDLISVGPHQPLPHSRGARYDAFTGMFRLLVDCQTVNPGVTESYAR